MPASAWVSELSQCFGFQLPNSLAGDLVNVSYLFKRLTVTVHEAEAHFENLSLSLVQTLESVPQLFLEQRLACYVRRVVRTPVYDEIGHARVPVVADRGIQ